MSKLFRAFIEIYTKDDINKRVISELSVEELKIFLRLVENYNRELEAKLIKKNELVFLKKNCCKLVLKRIWITLDEKDKCKLAKFFKDVDDYITSI
jgi:hypothetical protein